MNFMKPLRQWQREKTRRARAVRRRGLVLLALAGVVAASCNEQASGFLVPAATPPTNEIPVSGGLPSPSPIPYANPVERDARLCVRTNQPGDHRPPVFSESEESSVHLRVSRTSRGLLYPDGQVSYWGAPDNRDHADPGERRHYVQPELEIVSFDEERVNGRYEGRLVLRVAPVAEFVCRHVAFRAGEGSRREAYAAWDDLKVKDLDLRFNYARKMSSRTHRRGEGKQRVFEISYESERSLRDDIAYLQVTYDARFESGQAASVRLPVGTRLSQYRERSSDEGPNHEK